jgi:hypothetical protein
MARSRAISKEAFKATFEGKNKSEKRTFKALGVSLSTFNRYMAEYLAENNTPANEAPVRKPKAENKAVPVKLDLDIDLNVTVSSLADVVKNLTAQGFNVKISAELASA